MEAMGLYRRSILEYVSNTSMNQDNSLKFDEDVETTDPFLKSLINGDKELKAYFGDAVPKILNGAHYKVTSKVARGSQGVVMLAQNTIDMKLYVIKISNKPSAIEVLTEFMFQEHAHRVLKGACTTPAPKGFIRVKEGDRFTYMMVSKYLSVIPNVKSTLSIHQALKEHENSKPILSVIEWREVCLSLIDAVNTLQSNDIYHIDLKHDNILLLFIDDKVKPVIIDFGISIRKNSRKSSSLFTPGLNDDKDYPQIAPELFKSSTPLPTTDLYGISFTISQICKYIPLPSVQSMIKDYREKSPTQRLPYPVLRAATKMCFDRDIEKQMKKEENKQIIKPEIICTRL